jgi:ATP-dependent Zn protease
MLKSLGPPEGVEYIERERHATAIHEAAHAVVAYRVRHHFTIDLATIEKGQDYLGMVSSIPLEEQFTNWRSEFESDVMVSLAGLVSERMFFDGDSSSGVSSDLNSATTLAMYMEGYWGMGSTLGSHAVSKRGHGVAQISDVSRTILETELGRRIEQKLHDLMDKTERLLRDNRRHVLALAHALEANKTLSGDDVVAVIEGRKGTLIDGRPYASQEFHDAAERYHSRVVQAHKEHGHVDIPLPVLAAASVTSGSMLESDPHPEL